MKIAELVRTRHTCKAYDPQRPLSEEQLQRLQEILRFSPSSVNSQPWHFFLITSEAGKETLVPTLTEHNMEKVRSAPLTVVIATKTELDDAHLQALLAQEEQDGRFGGNEDAKKGSDAARRYYVGLNSTTPQKQQEWIARQAYISLGFLLMVVGLMAYFEETRIALFVGPAFLILLTVLFYVFKLQPTQRTQTN